jgi:hypothetical protein
MFKPLNMPRRKKEGVRNIGTGVAIEEDYRRFFVPLVLRLVFAVQFMLNKYDRNLCSKSEHPTLKIP